MYFFGFVLFKVAMSCYRAKITHKSPFLLLLLQKVSGNSIKVADRCPCTGLLLLQQEPHASGVGAAAAACCCLSADANRHQVSLSSSEHPAIPRISTWHQTPPAVCLHLTTPGKHASCMALEPSVNFVSLCFTTLHHTTPHAFWYVSIWRKNKSV